MTDDEEMERIFRALAGEPEPAEPAPTVRRTPWNRHGGRLTIGPFPYWYPMYLFKPWEVRVEAGYATSGRKGYVSRWLGEWYRLELEEYWEKYPMVTIEISRIASPRNIVVPWIVAADTNKAHKCPACGTYGGINMQLDEHPMGGVRPWRVYECREQYPTYEGDIKAGCGQRFARRGVLLPSHPTDPGRWARTRTFLGWTLRFRVKQVWLWKVWYPLENRRRRKRK